MYADEERFKLYEGDNRNVLKELPDNSIDSIVTDPPYELGFMGKSWDASGIAFNVEVWQECLRVLKPGGHLLAFSGSRTYHRMAVAIEDAGFEIRDQIQYIYGSGFPKSLNVQKAAKDKVCQCSVVWSYGTDSQATKPQTQYDLRPMSNADLSQTISNQKANGEVLLSQMSESKLSSTDRAKSQKGIENGKESSVEGWSNLQKTERQLQGSEIHSLPAGISADGSQGWLHNGTPFSDGSVDRQNADSNRSGESQESQSIGQSQGKPRTLSNERASQAGGNWKICGRCNKPIVNGWGTALKPAHEPIVVARKPLIGTVAANVLTYGTGGLNIDGARVGNEVILSRGGRSSAVTGDERTGAALGMYGTHEPLNTEHTGRWPANVIHDGSDEVVELFPSNAGGGFGKRGKLNGGATNWGFKGEMQEVGYGDSGSAARFFYCAKASKRDRNDGLEGFENKEIHRYGAGLGEGKTPDAPAIEKNHHPTVKPTDLMRYLCRLVTPPGGIVLDPFMGSGSTGKAAMYEGYNFIGIEMTEEYLPIAKARIQYALDEESEKLPDADVSI